MTNRTPPPLPTAQVAKPEQPAATKPTTLEQVQKTVGSVATCIQGACKLVEFVEKHLGTGSAKPAAFPANMPALPGFPSHMPALPAMDGFSGFPMPDMGTGMNPMMAAFPGFPMPDMSGMGMNPMAMNPMMGGFPGFSMPDMSMMGMGFDPNMMMGMGFDPNMMMGMGFDPNMMMGMGFGQM